MPVCFLFVFYFGITNVPRTRRTYFTDMYIIKKWGVKKRERFCSLVRVSNELRIFLTFFSLFFHLESCDKLLFYWTMTNKRGSDSEIKSLSAGGDEYNFKYSAPLGTSWRWQTKFHIFSSLYDN